MATWADRPASKPGNDGAVKMQKSIAMGMCAPASKRVVRVPGIKGGEGGSVKVPGLTNRK